MATTDSSSPGISVIIPAYNYAHYLPAAMDSVLQQDYPHFELIIVDDGSTDNTPAVVAAYGERVRYVHQKNAGLPAARNTGIRAARHEHVCFLDADDVLRPSVLREAMQTMSRLAPAFAIVAFPSQYIDGAGKLLPTKRFVRNQGEEITGRDIILKTRFGTTGLLAKREVFAECGFFDETLRSSEDRDMWIRISQHRRIFLHGEQLVLIRRHPNSMSRNSERMKQNMRRVIAKARQARCVPPGNVFFWLRVRAFFYFQTAWMFFDERQQGKAIREMLLSLLHWPWFFDSARLNEPRLFRLRALLRFAQDRHD